MTPADVAELARRARAAQPAWEALGFDGLTPSCGARSGG